MRTKEKETKKRYTLLLPPSLYESYREWAQEERRSTNAQIQWALEKCLSQAQKSKQKGGRK